MNLSRVFAAQLCVFLCITGNIPQVESFAVSTAINVAQYGFKGIQLIMGTRKLINEREWKIQLANSIAEIQKSTKRIESLITSEANRVIQELSVKFDMTLVKDFVQVVQIINERYEKRFLKYNAGPDEYQLETIEKFANQTIGESDFKKTLDKLNQYIVPKYYLQHIEDKRLFDILLDYYKIKANHHRDCDEGSSQHQQLLAVYNLVIMTLSRGYTMIVHAYKYRQQQSINSNAWEAEMKDAVEEYRETLLAIAQVTRRAMNRASREIRRCDPKNQIENVTYRRITEFLSLFLTSQPFMGVGGHCTDSCDSFRVANGGNNRLRHRFPHLGCHGTAYDCWTTNVVQICPGSPSSGRRYEALKEYSWFNFYVKGNWSAEKCETQLAAVDAVNRDPMCSICACTCDQYLTHAGTRTFSLHEQYTNVSDNRVVTGVRFNERNGIIFIEIQEGKLVNGSIDLSTVQWNLNASYPPKEGPETVKLTYHWRSVNLDDISVPSGFLVSGVRFTVKDDRLSLMVAGIPVYDDAGHVLAGSHQKMVWYSAKSSDRTELKLNNPSIPTQEKSVNVELSKSGEQFIKFQTTDFAKDASQTVVPYLDTQEVTSDPSTPLGGVGIFYKGFDGSGGFLSLKLIAANYTIHISNEKLLETFYAANSD